MEFEVRFTSDFIKRSLPTGARCILEVGCGSGELAASLLQTGLAVVAIDTDGDFVGAARRLGVDARVATWPDFEEGQFDAILFTRSLHHIHPLEKAVRQALAIWSKADELLWRILPTKWPMGRRSAGLLAPLMRSKFGMC
jgi:SAM-dependent methyltransferase